MNSSSSLALALVCACWVNASVATAQSVGRIRKSLDKATGGATAAPGQSSVVVANPQASTQAQAAAAAALAQKRNQQSQVGVDQRVVDFLKQRIEDGSADAAFDLAKRYEEGKGVVADPKESRRLYVLAGERGNEEAKAWLEAHPEPKKTETVEKAEKVEKAVERVPAKAAGK